VHVSIFKNREGQTTGKAVVEFDKAEDAEDAIEKFNNVEVDNVTHQVRPFTERKPNRDEGGNFSR